jgi:hypothetical protein
VESVGSGKNEQQRNILMNQYHSRSRHPFFKRTGFVFVLLAGILLFGASAATAKPAAAQVIGSELSAAEMADLLYMREEEKLAHDVYVTLYAQWGTPVFANIATAEETHTNAVLQLMARYGVDDPAAGNGVGVFANSELQALYDQLVAQGSQSLVEALLVGGFIEETDILDLQTTVAQTTHSDIQMVYQNLLAGSSNHLRAFAARYEQVTGEPYQPQVLDQAALETIIDGANGNGNGRRGGRWGGNNGNGNGVS